MTHDNAKFGSNAKERILQLALGGGEDDEETIPGAPPPNTSAAAERLRLVQLGRAYFEALAVAHRPVAPFVARPKLPRVLRQKVLERLMGQHLALAAARPGGQLERPKTLAASEAARRQALERASEQEVDVYQRSATAQVYQSLAARVAAADWRPPGSAADSERAYQERMVAEADKASSEGQQRRSKKSKMESAAGTAQPQHSGAPGSSAPAAAPEGTALPVLQEADLDWAGAEREEADRRAAQAAALRQRVRRRVAKAMDDVPAAAQLSAEERVVVADKCTEKVISKNCGGAALKREEQEDPALVRLVTEYVQHVKLRLKRPPSNVK